MSESYRRCCGIDVHKQMVMVCVLAPVGSAAPVIKKQFGTFRNELIRMRAWLKQLRVTEIALESTGVYWRPVWNVLEEQGFGLLLVNPVQVKALAGRKSDARDCQRIAEYLQDGRLEASFVPPREQREWRQLWRHRVSLLEQRNEVHNHIRDLLETASIKLSSVASDLLGVSGLRILKALAAGQDSPELLSWQAKGTLRNKRGQLKEAVKGYVSEFHRTMLTAYLEQYEFLTAQIDRFERMMAERMQPYQEQVERLCTIPGVDRMVAWSLLAELGVDLTVFPDAAHCASWAGLAPGTQESAGKQKSGRCKKGNRYVRRVLTQAAWANAHRKEGYLRALFHRIKARRGWAKAIVAVAHKILVIAYMVLTKGEPYRELGGDYFDRQQPRRTVERLRARLEQMGWEVELRPKSTQMA